MKLSSSDSGSISTNCSSKKTINFIKRNKMNVAINSKKRVLSESDKWNPGTKIDANYYKRKAPVGSNNFLPKSLQISNEKIIANDNYRQSKYGKKSLHDELKSNLLDIRRIDSLPGGDNKLLDPKTWSIGSNVEPLKLCRAGYTIEKYPKKIGR